MGLPWALFTFRAPATSLQGCVTSLGIVHVPAGTWDFFEHQPRPCKDVGLPWALSISLQGQSINLISEKVWQLASMRQHTKIKSNKDEKPSEIFYSRTLPSLILEAYDVSVLSRLARSSFNRTNAKLHHHEAYW